MELSKTAKLPKGAYEYRFDSANQILVVKWTNNKCVSMATNFHTIEPVAFALRWDRVKKSRVPVPQSKLIQNYNKYMGGADHHDWLLEKHSITIQGHFFIRGVDIAVVNTFLLYRRIHGSKSITLKDYNRKLAVTYFKKGYSRSVVKGRTTSFIPTSRANVPDGVSLIGEGHILEKRTN